MQVEQSAPLAKKVPAAWVLSSWRTWRRSCAPRTDGRARTLGREAENEARVAGRSLRGHSHRQSGPLLHQLRASPGRVKAVAEHRWLLAAWPFCTPRRGTLLRRGLPTCTGVVETDPLRAVVEESSESPRGPLAGAESPTRRSGSHPRRARRRDEPQP